TMATHNAARATARTERGRVSRAPTPFSGLSNWESGLFCFIGALLVSVFVRRLFACRSPGGRSETVSRAIHYSGNSRVRVKRKLQSGPPGGLSAQHDQKDGVKNIRTVFIRLKHDESSSRLSKAS